MTTKNGNGDGHDNGNGASSRRKRYAQSALLGEKNALANTKGAATTAPAPRREGSAISSAPIC